VARSGLQRRRPRRWALTANSGGCVAVISALAAAVLVLNERTARGAVEASRDDHALAAGLTVSEVTMHCEATSSSLPTTAHVVSARFYSSLPAPHTNAVTWACSAVTVCIHPHRTTHTPPRTHAPQLPPRWWRCAHTSLCLALTLSYSPAYSQPVKFLYATNTLKVAAMGSRQIGHVGRFTRFSFSAHTPHTHWWPHGVMM
jgi:hypothetical protein